MKSSEQKLTQIAKWYWKSLCSIHGFFGSPLKYVFDLILAAYFSISCSKAVSDYLVTIFGEKSSWQNYFIPPLWQFGIVLMSPLVIMPFLMLKEIEGQTEKFRSRIDKVALREEVSKIYEEGQELKNLLRPEYGGGEGWPKFTPYMFDENIKSRVEDWESKNWDLFNQKYPEFWEMVPNHKELPADIDYHPEQISPQILIWRIEKLGKILEDLSKEIRK